MAPPAQIGWFDFRDKLRKRIKISVPSRLNEKEAGATPLRNLLVLYARSYRRACVVKDGGGGSGGGKEINDRHCDAVPLLCPLLTRLVRLLLLF